MEEDFKKEAETKELCVESPLCEIISDAGKDTPILKLGDKGEIEIVGTEEQRRKMFEDWAAYIGEVQNPDNNAINPFFKSMYAPLDEVLNKTRPVLSKYGFGLFQSPTVKTGQVSVKTVLSHKTGGLISFPSLTLPIAKNDAQGIIAGITYARRGSLNPILATHGEIDDDGNTVAGKVQPLEKDKSKKNSPSARTSYNKTNESEEGSLSSIQKQIVDLCTQKIEQGLDRNDLFSVIADNANGKKNPNAIKDVDIAKKVLETIKNMEVSKNE